MHVSSQNAQTLVESQKRTATSRLILCEPPAPDVPTQLHFKDSHLRSLGTPNLFVTGKKGI